MPSLCPKFSQAEVLRWRINEQNVINS